MEGGSIYGASNSSGWRNAELFSRSSRAEDDEEALKWAALERLPTYNRLRKGLLTGSRGGVDEIDIDSISFNERQHILKKLVKNVQDNNEELLLKLKNRIDRVGIELPTIEVRYEHLNVEAEAYVGSRGLPTLFSSVITAAEGVLNYIHILSSRKKHLNILQNVSGIVKPGRMTLLLGPPSSGKSTLLLALSGKLDQDLEVSGKVTYNGHTLEEFVPQRTAAYISQNDLHIGELTVRETLAFSAKCQGVGDRYDMLAELSRREKAANIKPDINIDVFMKAAVTEDQRAELVTDYILKILGLEICADTMVGDQMIRGISGGQKKRVTTGEMLVGPAKALFMDEISTGLDSSTTYQIVNSLKQFVHIFTGTAVISLLQPAPETYNLFDDIILLSDGQIVYQGSREQVLEFFEFMGFKCPERKGVADFLQEVTSKKDQEQYWDKRDEPYRFISVKEFTDAFQTFNVGRRLENDLATPFEKEKSHPAALTKEIYGLPKKELLKACISREFLLMKRNSFVYVFKLFQLVIMAFVSMTVFFRTKMHKDLLDDGQIYMGALFFTLTMIMFNGFIELPMTLVKLPNFYKQRDLQFYPTWAYALPTWILKIPITFVEVGVWVFITYYVTGFDPNIGRLFKQYLILILVQQMASGLFRAIAAVGRNNVVSETFAAFALLILYALGGFVLSHDDIKKWWVWGYWISPMMYGQNAVLVNEFLADSWKHGFPNSNETLGVAVLKSRGFFLQEYWYWIGAGALFGFLIVFNLCFTLALTYLNPFGKPQNVKSDDDNDQLSHLGSRLSQQTKTASVEPNHDKKRGMVLPFQPHSIVFNEVTYSVDMPKEMKDEGIHEDKLLLLRGVSGAFRPGVLTALMGVSGAGKTTLMDVLAGRKTGGYVEGDIKISGHPKKQETFTRISGYCEQNDINSPQLTVYESVVFSAWLRLSGEVNSDTRKMFVEEVMELVELDSLRYALVGLPGVNGLSTEQRKRLTIAVELVSNPSIIFMDEPTSGLDARAAAIVMRTVRNTVDTGRTVVCTIHQPSIDIFEAFDELFLLKLGGEVIYAGPLGHNSCHLIKYFEGIEGVPKIKDKYNPATWMLEVTTASQEIDLGVDFADIYKNSDLYWRNKDLIAELSTPSPGSKDLYFSTQHSQPFFVQCKACLWKQYWSYWRNPPYTAIRIFFTAFIGLMMGSMFWDLGSQTRMQRGLLNSIGSMYTAVQFLGSMNANSVQPVVIVERTVFYRERAAGMYSSMPYAFAQIMIEIPYIIVQTKVYGVISYAMMGFEWTAVKFLWYLFFLFFSLLSFTFFGMMSVSLSPNHQISSVISAAFYGMWNLFSGFIIPRPRIPVWWRWYYWINPISWSLYGMITSQFGDNKQKLDTGKTVEDFLRDFFEYKHEFLGVVAGVMIGFTILFAFIFALAIRVLNFRKR